MIKIIYGHIKKNIYTISVLSIIVLGVFLRLHHIEKENLWIDEIHTAKYIEQDFLRILSRPYSIPPLYFIILKVWAMVFGSGVYSLRFFSAALGVLSIFLVFKLGTLLFSKRVGIYSAFLLALSVFHIFYSQEARNAILSLCLSLLSVIFFIYLIKEISARNVFYFSLFSLLLLASHYLGIFILIVLWVCFFVKVRDKRAIKNFLISQLIAFIFWGPFFIILAKNIPYILMKGLSWIENISIMNILISSLKSFSYGGGIIGLKSTAAMKFFAGILAVFFLVNFVPFVKKFRENQFNKGLLLGLLFFPIFIQYMFSKIFFPIYLDRNLILLQPFFYVLVANGIDYLKPIFLKILAICLILSLSFSAVNMAYNTKVKIPWDEVKDYLKKMGINKSALIIHMPHWRHAEVLYYFPENKCVGEANPEYAEMKDGQDLINSAPGKDLIFIDFSRELGNAIMLDDSTIRRYFDKRWTKIGSKYFNHTYISYYKYTG